MQHVRRYLAPLIGLALAVSLLVVARSGPAAADSPGCPTIVAHRAGADVAPENTAVGITMSAASGAPMVEMDVRWSANSNTQANPGYPVLVHDATLDRTTSGTGNVDDTGLVAMTKLSAADYAPWNTDPRFKGFKSDGSPVTPVPYAWDFVHASSAAGVDMMLDVKVTPGQWGAAKLMQYVDQFGYRDHLTYIGSQASVTAMHGWYPDLKFGVVEYPSGGRIYTPEYLRSLGATIYAIPWDAVTPALVAYMHAGGVQVSTWTSDRPEWDTAAHWTALRDAGVDAIVTNEPLAALTALHCGATPTKTPTTMTVAPTAVPSSSVPSTAPTEDPATIPPQMPLETDSAVDQAAR